MVELGTLGGEVEDRRERRPPMLAKGHSRELTALEERTHGSSKGLANRLIGQLGAGACQRRGGQTCETSGRYGGDPA